MVSEIVPRLVAGIPETSILSSHDKYGLQQDFGLTSLEVEMVSAVLNGNSNKDIAAQYSISEQTVKHRFTGIFTKLGISSYVNAICAAVGSRLLQNRCRKFHSREGFPLKPRCLRTMEGGM